MAGALVLLTLAAAACDDGTSAGASGGAEETLTIYSGREEEYVEGLFEDFEKSEGIDLEVRYGDSAELAATLAEEGEASPADVFFSQDAGSLGAVAGAGLFAEIDEEVLGSIDERFRSPENLWVGTSARARVAAYNTEALRPRTCRIPSSTSPSRSGRGESAFHRRTRRSRHSSLR